MFKKLFQYHFWLCDKVELYWFIMLLPSLIILFSFPRDWYFDKVDYGKPQFPATEKGEISIVRQNMMDDVNYQGYCGGMCKEMPRTVRMPSLQSRCPACGWISSYPDEFLSRYAKKHNLKP